MELATGLVGLSQIAAVGLLASGRFGWPALVGTGVAMLAWTVGYRHWINGDA